MKRKVKIQHPWRRDRIGGEPRTSEAHRKAIAEVKRRAKELAK